MIELVYQNECACVYDVDDWEILRKTYRIVGVLLGNTSFLPVLPMKLLPEEAYLLINKGSAKLVKYGGLNKPPDKNQLEKHKTEEEELRNSLKVVYRKHRKQQLESYIDKIVQAKRSKGDTRTNEEILEEELTRSTNITENNIIYPIYLKSNREARGEIQEVDKEVLLENTSINRCKIYADLWEKDYYITSGAKFGGHFLVYEGDPILYHALYTVRCVEDTKIGLHPSEIIAFGRLANSVKKRAILANYDQENDQVNYITISWPNI